MYIRDRWFFKDSIEVEEKHTGRYGAPGEKRSPRRKATPEQIQKQNQWRKERDLRRLIKANFGKDDYWITLTYRPAERPGSMEEAKRKFRSYIGKTRRKWKSMGHKLKYIVVTEIGSQGAVHHHLIVNRIPDGDKLLSETWIHGRVNLQLMYERGDFKDLAEYIAKPQEGKKKEKRISRSRNLVVPQPERRPMKRKTWKREPQAPKGYYLDKESLVEGINPVTGHRYRYYTLRRC